MGGSFSRWMYGEREIRVLIAGLHAAGKTTILYKMKLGEVIHVPPILGFNLETIDVDGEKVTAWDLGLRIGWRPMLRHYCSNTDALIFVVDSLYYERLDPVKELLYDIIDEELLRGVPLLVMANKQDDLKASTSEEIADKLSLRYIQNRPWHIVSCSAFTGDGLTEGLEWMVGTITGKMMKEDVKQSLATSVKDVRETASHLQEKTALSKLGFFYKGLEFLQQRIGCKARKQPTVTGGMIYK